MASASRSSPASRSISRSTRPRRTPGFASRSTWRRQRVSRMQPSRALRHRPRLTLAPPPRRVCQERRRARPASRPRAVRSGVSAIRAAGSASSPARTHSPAALPRPPAARWESASPAWMTCSVATRLHNTAIRTEVCAWNASTPTTAPRSRWSGRCAYPRSAAVAPGIPIARQAFASSPRGTASSTEGRCTRTRPSASDAAPDSQSSIPIAALRAADDNARSCKARAAPPGSGRHS